MVMMDTFRAGDVYIEFPYESATFRYEQATGKVFRWFYVQGMRENSPSSNLSHQAIVPAASLRATTPSAIDSECGIKCQNHVRLRLTRGMKLLSPACWLRIPAIYRIRYGDGEAIPHYLNP